MPAPGRLLTTSAVVLAFTVRDIIDKKHQRRKWITVKLENISKFFEKSGTEYGKEYNIFLFALPGKIHLISSC